MEDSLGCRTPPPFVARALLIEDILLMKYNFWWKTTLDWGHTLTPHSILCCQSTFDGRYLFDGKPILMEDDLWWKAPPSHLSLLQLSLSLVFKTDILFYSWLLRQCTKYGLDSLETPGIILYTMEYYKSLFTKYFTL